MLKWFKSNFKKCPKEEIRKQWLRDSEFINRTSVGRRGLSPSFFDKNEDVIKELTKQLSRSK